MTNLGNKNIFTKNLKMYMEQFGKNQKEMAALVQKIKYKKNRKDSHLSAGVLAVVVLNEKEQIMLVTITE